MQPAEVLCEDGPLKNQLVLWRGVLERSWSRETAYKKTDPRAFLKSRSAGQCAVTSILLINRLPALKKLKPRIALGTVLDARSGSVAIDYHGWIEIGDKRHPVIIDLTADQAESCNDRVVLATYETTNSRGLTYQRRHFLSRECARQQEVWSRYIHLSEVVARRPQGEIPVPGINTGLDLTGVTDNDVSAYLRKSIYSASDAVDRKVLNAAWLCAQEYSFSDTRTYPRPDHPDVEKRRSPLFTFVAIITSLRTTLEIEQRVVRDILLKYKTDTELLGACEDDLVRLLTPAGMASSKARTILGFFRYFCESQERDWKYLRLAPLEEVREGLLRIAGLGPKAVDCLLTVGLGRPSVAVDVNVFRVVSRLLDLEWAENPNYGDSRQVSKVRSILQNVVKDDAFLAQILHTVFLLHGKQVCRASCLNQRSVLQEYCDRCVRKYKTDPWQKGLF